MPLQFQNPNILWGLISLIIPIIIHLFNFKRFKPIYFSNLKYLKDITAENKNRSKIKSWLLLLTRLLALACLIIAFAQPYIPTNNTLSSSDKQKHVAHIYVDNSFSMNAETENGIAIEIAKAKAIELVNSLSNNTKIKILDNTKRGKLPFLNKERAISRIQEIQPTSASKLFSQIIQESSRSESSVNNKIYLFSDFQKYQADFDKTPQDSSLNVSLIPLPIQSRNNLYVDSCWFDKSAHKINQTEELKVTIHNSSDKSFRKIPIKLYINDSLKTVSNFDINAQERKELSLRFKNHKSGIYSGRIEISDYPITYDNKLYFSFQIQKSIELICVNQEKENTYINHLFSDEQYFKLKNLSKSQFHQENISKTKFIILNRLTDMQSGFRQNISHYINQGGRVLIIPNEENNDSNNELLNELGSEQFMQIDSLSKRVASIELNAEIYKEVFDKLKDDARFPLIFRHFKLSESKNRISIPLWKSKSGENLFSQTSIGEGKLYISTFIFDSKWTNAIKHPLFVPSLINIALNNKSHSPLYFNLNSEEYALANGLSQNSEKAIFHIENKALGIDLIPEQITHFDKGLLLNTHGQIKKAGNYFISQSQQILSAISFNYDRQESNLDFYSSGEIHDLLKTNNLNYKVFDINTTSIKTMVTEQEDGKSFWKLFLILTLAFLLIELIVQKMKFI
ncbi:BatA domain-containing protein [Ancylomarina sp. 16SWW S1-10-2]|uniref:BatA domain-containing protein n=1 Tax=Ancylomarina sp. 16SWW S1-10-2 TaxID=2499681 RepID=UPI0012AE4280|nr:BatA domain-containing protein [Ancylomarina sp. 16SWW S1-10-2]MRT92061.1 VWA domain-containing protein [Ancylomarina sp. 16SWW S1-10-2]